MFGFIICLKFGEKAKTLGFGKSLDILTIASVICKLTAEKISKEKNVSYENAVNFVTDSINEVNLKIIE